MEQICKTELYGSESGTLSSQGKDNNKEINRHEQLEMASHSSLGLGKFLRKGIQTIFGRRPKFSPARGLQMPSLESQMLGMEIQQSSIENEIQQSPIQNGIQKSLIVFKRDELDRATERFTVQIGRGSFGIVFRGVLSDGRCVAVKILSEENFQGEQQWMNELSVLSRLNHQNISTLVGYCVEDTMIVYDCMARSLSSAIFEENEMIIDWPTRFRIIMDIIRGLVYLHEGAGVCIVHKHIKPSNILLDENLNAKISDFGLAITQLPLYEDVMEMPIVGTYGYADPEYIVTGRASVKSDIYGFGMTVLNVISGKQVTEIRNFLSQTASRSHDKRRLTELIDPRLLNADYLTHSRNVVGTINIALQCLNSNSRTRPSASRVLDLLLSEAPKRHNSDQC